MAENSQNHEMDNDSEGFLPSPSSQEDDVIGEISSSDNLEDETEEEEKEEETAARGIPFEEKVYLSHNEALNDFLMKDGGNFLAGWTIDDITGLMIQLSKHTHERRGVELIAKNFRNTTVEELVKLIDQCKKINKMANETRFRNNQESSSSRNKNVKSDEKLIHKNWQAFFVHAKRSRGVGDESPQVLEKFLDTCANDAPLPDRRDLPDYFRIYTLLSSLTQGYALKGVRGMDAAVISDIFTQMEREIEADTTTMELFKNMFEDVQQLPRSGDIKLEDDVNAENAGGLMNILDIPVEGEKLGIFTKKPAYHPEANQ